MADLISISSSLPILSSTSVTPESFTSILNDNLPTVLNWSEQDINEAKLYINSAVLSCISQESNVQDTDVITFNLDRDSRHGLVLENHNDAKDVLYEGYYQNLASYVKDICKYQKAASDTRMNSYIDTVLCNLVLNCSQFENNMFDPTKALSAYRNLMSRSVTLTQRQHNDENNDNNDNATTVGDNTRNDDNVSPYF